MILKSEAAQLKLIISYVHYVLFEVRLSLF